MQDIVNSSGSADDRAQGLATDLSGSIYVAGFWTIGTKKQWRVRKYSPSGAPLWTEILANDNYAAVAVADR